MNKTRLEAFSDGVIAIIVTIMVLEMKAPEGTSWEMIKPLVPKFESYALSFLFIAIYWVNHHHLIHTVKKVNSGIMWANVNLLFWLSLVPFATAWMGENHFDKITVAVYAVLALFCGLSYNILNILIAKNYSEELKLKLSASKVKAKSVAAIALYTFAIPVAIYGSPIISVCFFAIVSLIWLIPDKIIEQALEE